LDFNIAISPLMPPSLGIWDTADCLEVGPTKLLIYSQLWPQQVAIFSVLSVRGAGERNGHDKESE
jgi:hypothetical protein